MLKRLCLAFAGLFAFLSLAQGAGTVPGFSLTPQFTLTGVMAAGCKLYVYQAGTVATPQNAYQDTGLTILQPNPMVCDAAGRLPQWFVADGSIKLRLTDKNQTQIFVGDNLLVVGPSSGGGGGGGSVDPTTIIATGDFKLVYNTGVLTGFVRCNGRTIGSATSGATERANADASALFSFLWNADANLSVSGGRGVSPGADFAANKALTLPDCRARAIAGIDDMGSGASGRLSASFFGAVATVLGAVGGSEFTTLTLAQLPTISVSGSNNITVNNTNVSGFPLIPVAAGGTGPIVGAVATGLTPSTGQLPYASAAGAGTAAWSGTTNLSGTNTISATSTGTSSAAHRTVQPTILATVYIKL